MTETTATVSVLNAEELGWIATAEQYARDVVSGEIPAGKWVILACKRYLTDLERALAGRGRWKFQPAAAALVIHIVGTLENIKGPEAGQKLRLMPWQLWVFCNVFGFKDRTTNLRRFRQVSLWLPRGSGKSSTLAALALVVTFTENEGGAEGYTAAVTRDQARIVFDIAKAMVERSPAFRRKFGVDSMQHSIFQHRTASSLRAISSDAKALDGLNVHFAVCDELASHKTKAVYDVLATAMGKRAQPLLISISTTTDNVMGVGRQVWDYTTEVLQGTVKDDRFFGVIYAADAEDDPWQEATWLKANPSWGQTVQPDAIRAIAQQAMASPALQQAFKTRHLNLWGGVDNSLFDLAAWDACCDPDLRLEAMAGRVCYGAIDMATRTDLAGAVLVFPEHSNDPESDIRVFAQAWLPRAAIDARRHPAYEQWAQQGLITVVEGETTDFDLVEQWVIDAAGRFDVRSIAYDPWALAQLSQRLRNNHGLPLVEYRPTVMNFSEPTKLLDAKMRNRRVLHTGDAVLRFCVSNVVGHYDARSNVYPRRSKSAPQNKIDLAIASIMALGVFMGEAMRADADFIYRDRELLVF
jgi:phage terminase large subunit-like protein